MGVKTRDSVKTRDNTLYYDNMHSALAAGARCANHAPFYSPPRSSSQTRFAFFDKGIEKEIVQGTANRFFQK